MSGPCNRQAKNCIQNFSWKTEKERDHSSRLSIAGRIILKMGLRECRGCKGMCWIHLAQNRNQWQILENIMVRNFLTR
jgi:hypothetical protein